MSTAELPTPIADGLSLVVDLETELLGGSTLTNNQRMFLAAYYETLSPHAAAELSGITRQAHYKNLAQNKNYKAIFDIFEKIAHKRMLDDWTKDADEGLLRLKFDARGNVLIDPRTGLPYEERQIDTIMRIFLMKSRMGLSDQGKGSQAATGPQINIIMPAGSPPPVIETNLADQDPPIID